MKAQFFKDHGLQPELIKKWKTLWAWTEACFPVYEWDGALFVVFSGEAPPRIRKKFPCVFVSAKVELTQAVWNQLNDPSGPLEFGSEPKPPIVFNEDFASPEGIAPSQIREDSAFSEAPTGLIPYDKIHESKAGEAGTSSDNWIKKVFEEMEAHFSESMILLKKENAFYVWKRSKIPDWPGSSKDVALESFSLDSPSPFRVVAKTQKPFHGAVSTNEITDSFFSSVNGGMQPDHLTISPLIQDEELKGFLLGIGDHSTNNKRSLSLADKMAQEISVSLSLNPEIFKDAS